MASVLINTTDVINGSSHLLPIFQSSAEGLSTPGLPLSSSPPDQSSESAITTTYIVIFSALFFLIGTAGLVGNTMVMYIVLSDRKMRRSMTNILILNLALADSLIMLFGLPEIAMFFMNKGWRLGQAACTVDRTVLVCALYCSVLTLVAVSIERYIAIVLAIKAHILCSKRRMLTVVVFIWLFSGLCASPTAVFNRVLQLSANPPRDFCITQFHLSRPQHEVYNRVFKYTESVLFYLGPLTIQVVCYSVIGRCLFTNVTKLHRHSRSSSVTSGLAVEVSSHAVNEAIRARKGVVKMLMASVAIYFLSYSPHQALLFYNTFSTVGFDKTWMFHVFTTTLAYINSAANPVLYCVFSEKFRSKFKAILHKLTCFKCGHCGDEGAQFTAHKPTTFSSTTEYVSLFRKTLTAKE